MDWSGRYGPGCRREVACGTYMEKLLSLQCLRDFGCVATLLSRGWPRAWAVVEKQEVLEELHTRTEKAEPPGEDDAGTRSESKSKIPDDITGMEAANRREPVSRTGRVKRKFDVSCGAGKL